MLKELSPSSVKGILGPEMTGPRLSPGYLGAGNDGVPPVSKVPECVKYLRSASPQDTFGTELTD